MNKKLIRLTIVLSVVLLSIGCDQISKNIVRTRIDNDENIHLLGNHLTVTKVENTGAFLSMGDSLSKSNRNILLSVLPLLALVAGFIYVLTKANISLMNLLGACFIIGGGIGNVYDRIVHGSVTDFLYIQFGFLHTGVFNLADTSIMLGAAIIVLHAVFRKQR